MFKNLFKKFKDWNSKRKLLKELDTVKERVSGYSNEQRKELSRKALLAIYPAGYKTCVCGCHHSLDEECPLCRKYDPKVSQRPFGGNNVKGRYKPE